MKTPAQFSHQYTPRSARQVPPPPGPAPQPSLLETVPGLQEQLMNIPSGRSVFTQSALATSTPVSALESLPLGGARAETLASASISNIEVHADAPVRSLRGGDLGMHFAPHAYREDETLSQTIAPVEGEVITTDIAYRGGYPVVTTAASAPPGDVCFLCASAGANVSLSFRLPLKFLHCFLFPLILLVELL